MANIANHLPAVPIGNMTPRNTCYEELTGAVSIALISGVVLGIIFGPLAAIAGVCCGGIIGAYVGLKIGSFFFNNELSNRSEQLIVALNQNIATLQQHIVVIRQTLVQYEMTPEAQRELNELWTQLDRSKLETERLNEEYEEIIRNNQQRGVI